MATQKELYEIQTTDPTPNTILKSGKRAGLVAHLYLTKKTIKKIHSKKKSNDNNNNNNHFTQSKKRNVSKTITKH